MRPKPPRLLIIAGSDSSGGAGIQADIKTASVFGVYAMTAITAVTVQDTQRVHSIELMPSKTVRDQIRVCLHDIGADAIKIGMLGSADIVEGVASVLKKHARGIPIVLDPAMVATSGKRLLARDAIETLLTKLLPLAAMVTPNLPEARALTGSRATDRKSAESAGRKLIAMGAAAALIKGGHATRETVDDVLVWSGGVEVYAFPRIRTKHTHGTGCVLSTAIACGLAQGLSLPLATGRAREFVQHAIETAPGLGRGHGPLNLLPQRK
ncbi:MAG TPA: bifunctional hydroxymethylpyrimidine kinase/phosphomethylpyrimidine kinase [Rhizomicrobium sp.]|nr:bifunctional hydroxymethylpyrimidine kinase/phosphomethylpyrimidine kinase [Rhizomicrobium sp.]